MVEVYDIETLKYCFTYTGKNVQTLEVKQFVISDYQNDYSSLVEHLKTLKGQIGFNNIGFDYPIIHYILSSPVQLTTVEIWQKAQDIINISDEQKFTVQIPEWRMLIPQLDLYKLNHFDNKARITSLKDLEFWMNYPNVQDMPIKHNSLIDSKEQIQMILNYNLNDVDATFEFYKLCKDKIELRKQLSKQYNLRLINANDAKIGSDIILDALSSETGIEKKELRQMRTKRPQIDLNEVIDTKISFRTKEFNELLKSFKSTIITSTKGSIENSVIYKGFRYDYGTGGLHGCIKAGIYESDDEYIIRDLDVASLYPSIAIINEFYPEHLGKAFVKVYSAILKQRIEAKRAGNKAVNEGLKLSLNGAYG